MFQKKILTEETHWTATVTFAGQLKTFYERSRSPLQLHITVSKVLSIQLFHIFCPLPKLQLIQLYCFFVSAHKMHFKLSLAGFSWHQEPTLHLGTGRSQTLTLHIRIWPAGQIIHIRRWLYFRHILHRRSHRCLEFILNSNVTIYLMFTFNFHSIIWTTSYKNGRVLIQLAGLFNFFVVQLAGWFLSFY